MQRFIDDSETKDHRSPFKQFFHHHVVPKGILLFHSPYLKDERSLVFPLRKQVANEVTDNQKNSLRNGNDPPDSCFSQVRKWFSPSIIYENVGCEEFLDDARNILIHERSARIESRRQRAINKRNKEMRKSIKEIRRYLSQSSFNNSNT